jgi:FkbM family methyltransferase
MTKVLHTGLRRPLRSLGLNLTRWEPPTIATSADLRRVALLRHASVSLVLDVGANVGQYGRSLRDNGYNGRIVSFEPLSEAFQDLQKVASADDLWDVRRCALGAESAKSEIGIAGNSLSSSLLAMHERHERALPTSRYVGREKVDVYRLDDLADGLVTQEDIPFLKLDVQGYEERVLDGASAITEHLAGVEVELSLVPLYEGAPEWRTMIDRLEDLRFFVASIEPGFIDRRNGQVLQVDAIFLRLGSGLS